MDNPSARCAAEFSSLTIKADLNCSKELLPKRVASDSGVMDRSTRFWLVYSAVGVVTGASGCVVFMAAFQNYHAGSWALISCVPAAEVLLLHYSHLKGRRIR